MNATQFASQFAVKAAKVNAEEPSTSKWNGVRNLFAEDLGIDPDDVYVATISKPGNVSVRFGQSAAARSADVLIAMHTGRSSELEGTVEAVRRVAAPQGRVGVITFHGPAGWSVAAVVGPPGDAIAAAIAASSPNAVLLPL
jgi:hypothetical protein